MNIDIQALRSKMQLPSNLQNAYDRVVLAGMKVMFDKQTHQMMLDEMNKPGAIDDKLSQGIIGLMLMLWKQSNQTMPPQVIIPAAIELLMQAADFVEKSKTAQITDQDISAALQKAVFGIMQEFGIDPDRAMNTMQQAGQSKKAIPFGQNKAPQPAQQTAGGM